MTTFQSINFEQMTPADLILARSGAFSKSDFGFIFDSYHSESNFRRQFDDRDEYIQYGLSNLGPDFAIRKCDILVEETANPESRVIFLMEMEAQGSTQLFVELAWLRKEGGGWRYHRGQKITLEELPESPGQLGFDDFDQLSPATIF